MRPYFVTLMFALLALTAGQARGEYAARPTLASVMELFMPPENSRGGTLPWDVEADNPAITWYEITHTSENGGRLKQGAILLDDGEKQGWEPPGYGKPTLWLVILEGGPEGVETVTLFPSDGPLARYPSNGRSLFEEAAAQNRRMKFSALSPTVSSHNGYEIIISRYRLSCFGRRSVTVEHARASIPDGGPDELTLILSENDRQADTAERFIDRENEPGMPGNRADTGARPNYPDTGASDPGRADANKNSASWDSEVRLNERLEKSRKMARDLMQ